MSDKILIIDGMNLFIRNYVMNPAIASSGSPIGGTFGYLQSLQKLIREINPDKVINVWDGGGGSAKRRSLSKNYKEGRAPLRLNRAYSNLSAEEETQNRYGQMIKTIEYLNEMPIVQILIDDVEADDVIGYICGMPQLKEDIKIIVSMDKDFFQLCDDKTIVYRPVQKKFLNKARILEEYKIHPTNFALARAIDGDKSDNLEGVKGVGMKTIAKKFPFFAEEKTVTLDALRKHCIQADGEIKLHKNILKEYKKVVLNYKLMQLYSPSISVNNSKMIVEKITKFEPKFNRTNVVKMMKVDGFNEDRWSDLFQKFRSLVAS